MQFCVRLLFVLLWCWLFGEDPSPARIDCRKKREQGNQWHPPSVSSDTQVNSVTGGRRKPHGNGVGENKGQNIIQGKEIICSEIIYLSCYLFSKFVHFIYRIAKFYLQIFLKKCCVFYLHRL